MFTIISFPVFKHTNLKLNFFIHQNIVLNCKKFSNEKFGYEVLNEHPKVDYQKAINWPNLSLSMSIKLVRRTANINQQRT